MKVAEGQHKETKPDRADVGEGEGVYLLRVLLKRKLVTQSLGSRFINLFSFIVVLYWLSFKSFAHGVSFVLRVVPVVLNYG